MERGFSRLREGADAGLKAAGEWMERHGVLCLCGVLALYGLAALRASLAVPLGHDELFTYYIARAKTGSDLLALTRTVDLNPPLSYWLTRAVFAVFGAGTLQTRLPEIAGFGMALAGLFLLLRRRVGSAYAVAAAVLLLTTSAVDMSIQARPYGLMLGFGAMTLAAWQAACRRERAGRRWGWEDAALLLATTALLLTHVFSVLLWGSMAAGELAGCVARRRLDAVRALAMLLPLAAVLTYLPLLANHGASAFPLAFQPKLETVLDFYTGYLGREMLCALGCVAVLMIVQRAPLMPAEDAFSGLSAGEWVCVAALAACPVALIAWLMRTHGAFFDRYAIAATLGAAIFLAAALVRWSGGWTGGAAVVMALGLLLSGELTGAIKAVAQGRVFRDTEPTFLRFDVGALKDASLPLVDGSGLTFVEMQAREPAALLDRVYYLTDHDAALTYAHATIFEGMEHEAQVFGFQGHAEPYAAFLHEHRRFYVLGDYAYPEEWLLRKLRADGARLTLLGDENCDYTDHALYEVTLP